MHAAVQSFVDKQLKVWPPRHQIEKELGAVLPELKPLHFANPVVRADFFSLRPMPESWSVDGRSHESARHQAGCLLLAVKLEEKDLISVISNLRRLDAAMNHASTSGCVEDGESGLFASAPAVWIVMAPRDPGWPMAPRRPRPETGRSNLFDFAAAMWSKGRIMMCEMQRRAITVATAG